MSAAKIFAKIFHHKNLEDIYNKHISSSRAIGIDRIRPADFNKNLSAELEIASRKIKLGTYRFTPYKEKLISKGAGRPPRVVSIPSARDRIILRGLCDLLQTVFHESVPKLPQATIGSLSKSLESEEYGEYIKIDLKDFYPTLPHPHLFTSLKRKIRKKEIISLIEKAVQTPTVLESKGGKGAKPATEGVPQGLAISNILAEITLRKIDERYESHPNIFYKRYVDDILILTPTGKSSEVADKIIADLNSTGLNPHPINSPNSKSKTGLISDKFTFLGYQVENNKLSIKPESIRKYESSLAGIFTAYRHKEKSAETDEQKERATQICEWKLNLRITGCVSKGKSLGWVFYFSQINDLSCLAAVQNTIDSMMERFSLKSSFSPKSLLKTHYESKRNNKLLHTYIPNFDTTPIEEKRKILSIFYGKRRISKLTDPEVEKLFEIRIKKATKDLEVDLGGIS